MKQRRLPYAIQSERSAPFRLIQRFCLLCMRAGLHPMRYSKAGYHRLRLAALKYRRKVRVYRMLTGMSGLVSVIWANLTKTATLVTVKPVACRFPFVLRMPASDTKAFEQIFIDQHYAFAVTTEPTVIVDAGANIGLAAIYFANRYPRATIIALEPEPQNFALLKQNVTPYANIVPLQSALWHRNEEVPILDPGRGEWGFITWQEEAAPDAATTAQAALIATVPGYTVDQLMVDWAIERINLLKIDIEGAEIEVFRETTPWIDKVDALIIELHDYLRPGCRASFDRGAQGFDVEWLQGENLIRAKGDWLAKGAPEYGRAIEA